MSIWLADDTSSLLVTLNVSVRQIYIKKETARIGVLSGLSVSVRLTGVSKTGGWQKADYISQIGQC